MFRHTGKQIWISNDYQGEWTKYFGKINTTFWYKNHTSLYLKGELFDIEMSNRPFLGDGRQVIPFNICKCNSLQPF